MHALSTFEGPIEIFFQFHLKSTGHAVLLKLILKVDFEILQFLPEIKAVHARANLVLSNRISALTFALCTANKFWHNTPSCNQETLSCLPELLWDHFLKF